MADSVAMAAQPERVLLRFAPAVLIIFFGYLTIGMQLGVLPLQIHDHLAFSTLVVGITIGIQSFATLSTRQIAGSLCDRHGPKRSVILGGGCSLAASLIYLVACAAPVGAAAALGAIIAARLFLGLGESLLMTGALAWAIAVVGPRSTGKVMVWVGISMYAAVAAGAPLGVWLATAHLIGGGFVVAASGAIACSLVTALVGVLIAPVAPHGGDRLPFIAVAGRIAPFGAGLALATMGFGAIATFAALDFQRKGWPGAEFALAAFGTAYIATRILFGHWPDRFGGARVALCSLVIEAGGQVLLWLAPVPAAAFLGTIMTGAGFSLVFPSFGIEAVRQVSPANRGSALATYAAFFDLGFALSGPLTGAIAGAFGYPEVFAVGGAAAIAAVVLAWSAVRNGKKISHA